MTTSTSGPTEDLNQLDRLPETEPSPAEEPGEPPCATTGVTFPEPDLQTDPSPDTEPSPADDR